MQRLFSPNQMVAYNLSRIRRERGLTQQETVELLAPFLRSRWSVASLSAAERSVDRKRIKEFDADELIALSRAFDLPLMFWFIPPPAGEGLGLATTGAGKPVLSRETLLDVVFGRPDNRHVLENALLAGSLGPEPGSVIDRFDAHTALRLRARLRDAFGDLGQARHVLERVAGLLDQLDSPDQKLSGSADTHDDK